jgi:hypothetical protein
MSLFNEDQQDYMRSLAKIPTTERCWCGWYSLGECPNCPRHLTCADKITRQCPYCHNEPDRRDPDGPITHNIRCATRSQITGSEGPK